MGEAVVVAVVTMTWPAGCCDFDSLPDWCTPGRGLTTFLLRIFLTHTGAGGLERGSGRTRERSVVLASPTAASQFSQRTSALEVPDTRTLSTARVAVYGSAPNADGSRIR